MTTQYLTKENILELLDAIGFNNPKALRGYGYNFDNKTLVWKKFVERYQKNNPDVVSFVSSKDLGYFTRLLTAQSKNVEENKTFADIFAQEHIKIKWYSDDFWTLLCMRFICETDQYWDEKKQGSRTYSYADSQNTGKKIAFLKSGPKENQFEGLTYFLENGRYNPESFFILWLDLAKKKANQAQLKGKPILNFVLNYSSYATGKAYFRKINALALFETEEAINEIVKIRDKNLHDAKLLELANETLKKLGEETKEIEMVLEEGFGEKIKYVQEKILNPQALIQQKVAKKNQVDNFLELLTHFLENSLHNKGVQFSSKWKLLWDEKISQEKSVFVLTTEIDYKYQCEEVKLHIENAIKAAVNYFFTEKNQDKLITYLGSHTMKNEFNNFFNPYLNSFSLKEKLEKETVEDKTIVSKRKKI